MTFYGFEVLNTGLAESYNDLGHNLGPVGIQFGRSKFDFKIWWKIFNCLIFDMILQFAYYSKLFDLLSYGF